MRIERQQQKREDTAGEDSSNVSSLDEPQSTSPAATCWPEADSLFDISEHQREQYRKVSTGCLSVLGGRPGTGKTFTLARIIGQVQKTGAKIAVCGPTGKSMVRLTEVLESSGVCGIRGVTTHSLLGVNSANGGSWEFEHDEENPLPYDWIFIDEAPMYSTPLLGSLLAARREGCRVLVVGDVNQLAPVEHGAPLRDLKEILPYGELIEIQRNSGRIVKACHEIIDKQRFVSSEKIDLQAESPENLFHVERTDPESQIASLRGMLEKFSAGKMLHYWDKKELKHRKIDPVWDCQILVPINDKSDVARKPLNFILQNLLNPGGEQVKGCKFRVGDKVVNGRNGLFTAETEKSCVSRSAKIFSCNGDVGRVEAIVGNYMVVRLWLPNRIIRVPIAADRVKNDDGDEEAGMSWDLGYASSVHKAQGSEWPVCITVIDPYSGARQLCDRSWLYTSLSRAKILAVTLGQRCYIDSMVRKSKIWNRKTFLRERILENVASYKGARWADELEDL